VAARLEAFIRSRARVSVDDSRFSRQSHLWEEGYLDSIGVVEMIGYIEATFCVALPDEVLFDPDFTTVEGISTIVSALPTRNGVKDVEPTQMLSPNSGSEHDTSKPHDLNHV
jgi:acyl carrier protein